MISDRAVPIFIAYRQGAAEGDACAEWLHAHLSERTIPIDGEMWPVDVYWDQLAPAVDDWTEVWEGYLRTAQGLILVCTAGVAARRDGSDWLYDEIRWWVDNRDDGPIIINATDLDPAPVPAIVRAKWPRIQWVDWTTDRLTRERALTRIVEGLVLAAQGVRYQELERTRRLLHEAEVANLDALAALNKAEALRIGALPAPDSMSSDRAQLQHEELQLLGGKYQRQMNELADRADTLRRQGPPDFTPQLTGLAPPAEVFTIEALDARHGSCLLIRYGTTEREHYVLIDGGPEVTYRKRLKPRLEELRHGWAGDGPLEIEAVISTQADRPESGGIIRLLEDLAGGAAPFIVKRFWTNVFDPYATAEQGARPVMGVLQIPHLAQALGLPVNRPFDRFVSRPLVGAPVVELEGGLRVTVLGPTGDFSEFWVREVAEALAKRSEVGPVVPQLPGVIETCASDEIYLQPSPVRVADIDPGRSTDASDRNRTSIVLLLEFAGRRALLTSDALGPDIIEALSQTGLLDTRREFEPDLVSIPHYGSRRNVDPAFFATIRARRYLIQGNGAYHGLPHPEVIEMLAQSRGTDRHTLYLTHGEGPKDKPDHFAARDRALAAAEAKSGMSIVFRRPEEPALVIDLMADPSPPEAT